MIDAFIEIARDYSRIILEDSENTENIYTKTMLKYKANKFLEMADYIATEIGYNKSCKITKDIDDVGMDAFSIMGRRNRPKKNENVTHIVYWCYGKARRCLQRCGGTAGQNIR